AEQLLATLQPGESWAALQAEGAGQTLTVMDNFQLSATRGEPRAEVAVVALADLAGDPWGLPLAVPDPQGPVRCRGWFDHADRQGQVSVPLTRVQWLDLAGPTRGPYARHLPGEYEPNHEPGEDHNRGNYGVLYELDVSLENPGPAALTPYLLLNSAGGPGGLVATVDGELKTSRMLPAYGSMLLARPAVPAGGVTVVKLVFSLPGGASGAHRLFFWPAP
ncbi:MAG: hypothetical protein HUU35_11445, partial [Armatimonadetes bacterium]|nr:hypothetical protein [Armatimonadota bacterium]